MEEKIISEIKKAILDNQVFYQLAIGEVVDYLEEVRSEIHTKESHRSIHQIQTRIKTPASVMDKVQRKGIKQDLESIMNEVYDIAGVRVICPFIEDVFVIRNRLIEKYGEYLKYERNYIDTPKKSGYRSIHLLFNLPVADKKNINIEIQLRTIAMDFWASLEHTIHYKAKGEISNDILSELKMCAEIIAATDERMQQLSNEVHGSGNPGNNDCTANIFFQTNDNMSY